MRKLTALAAALGSATVLAGALGGTALADPPAGSVPKSTDVVGVGSDTVQFLFDQAASAQRAHDTQIPANGNVAGSDLYSYDATNPSTQATMDTIVTKAGATPIPRPNGSGQGIAALTSTTAATVDFARSSRARTASDSQSIRFVAYARDAVTVADGTDSNGKTNVPSNLDANDLNAIYNCTATTFGALPDDPATGANASQTITPFLPQSGSGTRAFFLSAIGVANPGGCVTSNVEENEGDNSALQNNPNIVFPYSIAVALAQILHKQADGITTSPGTLTFQNVGGQFPAAYSSSQNTYVINPSFPSAFQRSIYNVVRADTTTSDNIPAYLEGLFGTNGALCTYGSGLISNFGFTPLTGSDCGAVS